MVLEVVAEVGRPLGEAGIVAVGHRLVHGGKVFYEPTIIDDDVVRAISDLSSLAPLHNPANVIGIEVAREVLPDVPHVGVFDTAFFHTLPAAASTYAIDRSIAQEYDIRRYGFHGTSHQYVSSCAAQFLGRDTSELDQIVLHLGNGASASAIHGGRAVDTSMGFTPLEGLVMGTRSGDIDPGVLLHLYRQGLTVDRIDDLLNRQSGLRGLSGVNDFRSLRTLVGEGNADAALAYDVYVHRLRKYIGAYLVELGGADVITFTGEWARTTSMSGATAWRGSNVSASLSTTRATARNPGRPGASPRTTPRSKFLSSPPTRSWRLPGRQSTWWVAEPVTDC